MDEVDSDGVLRHRVPMYGGLRWFFVIAGLFCIIVSTWELYRGVWPPNFASPFFLFIILGAYSVGIPIAYVGLFAPNTDWRVRRGRIDIIERNPFRPRWHRLRPADVAGFGFRTLEHDDGEPTYTVVMTTRNGAEFTTRDFGTMKTATLFRDRIETLFGS